MQGVNFYHPQQEDKRIELVYEAGRKITPINLADSNEVRQHLPFALVSCKQVSQEIPAAILKDVDTLRIDRYDDNKHPAKDRHYTSDFINYVTLIKSKNNKTIMNETAKYEFTIVVPIYNEQDNLSRVEEQLSRFLPTSRMKACVLLVNDGSSDDSLKLMKEICQRQPDFFYISSNENHGLSTAMKAGIDTGE